VTLKHHLPGRLRLRAGVGLAMSGLAGSLETLREAAGVGRVTVNPATGSVLVEYDAAVLSPALVQALFEARDGKGLRRAAALLWPGGDRLKG